MCQEVEPKKRGRPTKPSEFGQEATTTVTQSFRHSTPTANTHPSSPLVSNSSPINFSVYQHNQLYPCAFKMQEGPTSPLRVSVDENPLFQSGTPSPVATPPDPFPAPYRSPFPFIATPETQGPVQNSICPPGFGVIGTGCASAKFTEAHLSVVFLHLAKKAGYPDITPELKATMNKIIGYYTPLVAQYGANLLDMCPSRLMAVGQMYYEFSLPAIVAGCFFLLTANAAALELTGLKKSDMGPMAPTKRFIFDVLHPEDAIPFVMKSVECLVSFTDLDRMKVRLVTGSNSICHCVISETIHRNPNGVPLFSSFTIVRVDDLYSIKH